MNIKRAFSRMGKIHKQARERLLEIQARQREKTENLVAALAGVIEAVRSDESSASKVERIGQVFAGRGGIKRLQEDCEAVQARSNNNYFPLLGPPYKPYRHLLFRLVGALRFVSTTQNRSLLDAVAVVQTNPNRRAEWVPAGDIDFSFVTDRRWDNVVFRTKNGRREIHWRQFEICMFTHLALELRTGDMAVVGSEQYADYRDRLLPWEECDLLLESYCSKVGLPRTAEEFVQQLRTELETTAADVDEAFPSNTAVSIKDGEPVLSRPAATKPPVSALELEAALQTVLPEQSLLDIVWLTNVSTRFTRHFGPISGLDAKLDQIDEKYCAAVFVMGSSMGVTQGARHMRGLVTSPTLALINRRHVTVDKLDAAHRDILDAYNRFELPHCWGTGKTAAFDGSLFELSEQNLLADFHFRYRLKGAVAFQVVSDLYIALFMHFIPPGVWEAIYIIEALMKNRSKIQPDTVFADTQGQSTPVFAFTYLLGIKLMPRIRNWKDLNFFRPSIKVNYKHIDGLFKDAINWELIRTHWRDLMQVALSIYTGRVSSPILLRKLSHYSRKNRLYLAAQELGRVQRTVYLLRWISDLSLRSGVTAGTNSVIASIAAGPLIDNKGKKTGFLVGLSLMIVSLLGLPYATGRGMIAACMFLLGLGGGTVVTGANTLVSDVGAERRASMLNLAHVFFGVGGLLTPFVAANILGGNPMRLSYLVALLALLALAFQAAISMPPPTHEGRFQLDAARKLPGKWILVLLSLYAFLYVACEVGFWNWLPKYLIGRGMPENRALNILGFGFAVGMLTGRLVGTRLLLRVSADTVCLIGSLLIAGTTFWTLRAQDPTFVWFCVFLAGFVMGPVFPSVMGLTGDAFPLMTATCMGIVITAGWTGTVVSSWLIGTVAGTHNGHLGAALLLLPVLSVGMLLTILVLRPMLARARRQALTT